MNFLHKFFVTNYIMAHHPSHHKNNIFNTFQIIGEYHVKNYNNNSILHDSIYTKRQRQRNKPRSKVV